jgi:hypothetical protein
MGESNSEKISNKRFVKPTAEMPTTVTATARLPPTVGTLAKYSSQF